MTRTEEYQNALNGYRNLDVSINKTLRLIGISAIKKQIPKKVKGDYHSCPHYRCPNCNSSVKMYDDDNTYPYCAYCGQALDWSDTE